MANDSKLYKGFLQECNQRHTLSGPQCNCIVKFYEFLLRISLDFVQIYYSLAVFHSHTTIKQINSNLFIFNRPIRLHLVNFACACVQWPMDQPYRIAVHMCISLCASSVNSAYLMCTMYNKTAYRLWLY